MIIVKYLPFFLIIFFIYIFLHLKSFYAKIILIIFNIINMTIKKENNTKIEVSKHVEKTEELIKMMSKLKQDKKLLFHVYDSLKGFDLIMSVLWKEKIIEYFVLYMKNSEEKLKNYSKFISFVSENEWSTFLTKLREVYNWIVDNYDSIKFGKTSYHFWSEEIYLRETLEKIKSILESLWELKAKWKFININLTFLNWTNSNLDFKFNDTNLEEIWFYSKLDLLDEDTSEENLLPFFHLLNNLIEELKITEERVIEMINEEKDELVKNTDFLYKQKEDLEKESINKAKKEITSYLKKKDIKTLWEIIEKNSNILNDIERNKNLPQSIVNKDIETLEKNIESLEKIV